MDPVVNNTQTEEGRQNNASAVKGPVQPLPMVGDYGKDPTPRYWLVAMPALTLRYAARFLLRLFDYEERSGRLREHLQKTHPSWAKCVPQFHVLYPILAGTVMTSITAFFARQTYRDMKTLFRETVAFEFNKDPAQITMGDLYKSQNTVVKSTMRNFTKFNIRRFFFDGLFFVPWTRLHELPGGKKLFVSDEKKLEGLDAVDIGAAGIAYHLENDSRKRSQKYFEYLQSVVTKKINHESGTSSEAITPNNMLDLMVLHKRALNKSYKPVFNSPQWQNDIKLAERIMELLNQTYNENSRTANFTIGKFNYLLGFGLLDTFPESLAFVELANRYGDMKEVNQAAAAIRNGMNPEAVFVEFGITLKKPGADVPVVSDERNVRSPQEQRERLEMWGQSQGNENTQAQMCMAGDERNVKNPQGQKERLKEWTQSQAARTPKDFATASSGVDPFPGHS